MQSYGSLAEDFQFPAYCAREGTVRVNVKLKCYFMGKTLLNPVFILQYKGIFNAL